MLAPEVATPWLSHAMPEMKFLFSLLAIPQLFHIYIYSKLAQFKEITPSEPAAGIL